MSHFSCNLHARLSGILSWPCYFTCLKPSLFPIHDNQTYIYRSALLPYLFTKSVALTSGLSRFFFFCVTRFLRATLESWERPGDEAIVYIQSLVAKVRHGSTHTIIAQCFVVALHSDLSQGIPSRQRMDHVILLHCIEWAWERHGGSVVSSMLPDSMGMDR